RMTNAIQHRGPDDSGIRLFDHSPASDAALAPNSPRISAALGHRRLSIIDLDSGHQPLANEDETVWIAFNGEIYNYRELRSDLEALGHSFRTRTDTECIVHLWEQYGVECVNHLRGMFAFAVWDDRTRTLFLARDRIGQKPLFYRLESGRLTFASELKALLQIPDAPRNVSPTAIDQYLTYQYVPHPHCILDGYQKLAPAHWARYDHGDLTIHRYWQPPYADVKGHMLRNASEWQDELRSALTEAVRLRLRSDVPLGSFLSGGVDSTIITGITQQLSDQPAHSFSIGFPIKAFDERVFAREAAAHLGTQHHEDVVEPSAVDILPKLTWHYDEPFADSSAIPTMYLSDMTRRHVKVALSGDGGDELFAGYDRYRAVGLASRIDRLPRLLKRILTSRLWQSIPSSSEQKSKIRLGKRFLAALAEEPRRRYLMWIGIFDEERRRSIYTDTFREQLQDRDAGEFLFDAYRQCPERDFVTRTTCADVLTYLPCDILTKVDIASMAYGLEARSPFLDHHVVELAARMPMEFKRRRGVAKAILIDTFAEMLPKSIQTRPKMGFGVPLAPWMRGELKPLLQDLLLDATALSRGYFRRDAIERLIEDHLSGRWDHSARLWALLCLESWHRTFVDTSIAPAQFVPV
ncbi:MAG: asparagine synthase (glutamine-hydrolyzing), partial [Planctomycetota bacterium]|nr:asparagine synthase (glutamine-hydrolyzing) [Planctomycetota bacterium]